MEHEISLVELFIVVIRFFKRHSKKYVITLIFYFIVGIILFTTYKTKYEVNIPIYSSFFKKSDLNDLVNIKLINYKNDLFEIKKDTSSLSQFILVKIVTTDTTILPKTLKEIKSILLNNPYSQKHIKRTCKYNKYIYAHLADSLQSFYNNIHVNTNKQQIIYTINPVYIYAQIFYAKRILNKCKTKTDIIEIYPSLVTIHKSSNLIKNEVLAFFLIFFIATALFFFEDLYNLISKQNEKE